MKTTRSSVFRAAGIALAVLLGAAAPAAGAATLDKIRAAQEIVVAHRNASVPFSYLDAGGRPIGYSMDICMKLVDAVRRELAMPALPCALSAHVHTRS